DELLAEPLGEPLPHQARENVGGAPGGKADQDAYRPQWIILPPCGGREGRQRSRARCEPQQSTAGKLHTMTLPLLLSSSRQENATIWTDAVAGALRRSASFGGTRERRSTRHHCAQAMRIVGMIPKMEVVMHTLLMIMAVIAVTSASAVAQESKYYDVP